MRYTLPVRKTLSDQLLVLGAEGRAVARDFIVRLLKSGVKPTITGDLWSESGMGLFGIYAHGITKTWVMEKALIGPCWSHALRSATRHRREHQDVDDGGAQGPSASRPSSWSRPGSSGCARPCACCAVPPPPRGRMHFKYQERRGARRRPARPRARPHLGMNVS
jgi:hypothetical protein